jgi:hypothetical protein
MLGRVRRTTQADVGMAITLAGVSYMIWALAMGVCRHAVGVLTRLEGDAATCPASALTGSFRQVVGGGWLVWDLAGVLWLLLSLVAVIGASRQRWSNSWTWLSAILQSMTACLVAVWAALALAERAGVVAGPLRPGEPAPGWTSLPIAIAVALLLWVTVLVVLLLERARLGRGPSLRDGLRTHISG